MIKKFPNLILKSICAFISVKNLSKLSIKYSLVSGKNFKFLARISHSQDNKNSPKFYAYKNENCQCLVTFLILVYSVPFAQYQG